MKYTIQVSELLSRKVVVEAESAELARQKVEDDYVDGSVQFEIVDCT